MCFLSLNFYVYVRRGSNSVGNYNHVLGVVYDGTGIGVGYVGTWH